MSMYIIKRVLVNIRLALLIFFGLFILRFLFKRQSLLEKSLNEFKVLHILDFYQRISNSEFQVFSQNKEDGVLVELINTFDLNQTSKFFVEIGTETGEECNTRYLREFHGWNGEMFDGYYTNDLIPNLHKEMILWYEVTDLFKKYNITKDIDLLSIDTDYADFWILEAILEEYSPKLVVHEINHQPPSLCVSVPKSRELLFWDGTQFQGASLCAFDCLAKRFGYSVIYCESAGINCFWIRNDLIQEHLKVEANLVQSVLTPKFLFRKAKNSLEISPKKWENIVC